MRFVVYLNTKNCAKIVNICKCFIIYSSCNNFPSTCQG